MAVFSKLLPFSVLEKPWPRPYVLPFYHMVSDAQLPEIARLYPLISTARFNKDMDFFLSRFTSISLDKLAKHVQQKASIDKPSFHLSFDDGFRTFHDVVAAILLRKGIHATCFINTAFLDNKALFYRIKAGLLLERLCAKTPSKALNNALGAAFAEYGMSFQAPKDFLNIDSTNQKLLDDCAAILEMDFNQYLKTEQPYLSTEQVHSLLEKGFTIGAHSHTHPNYYLISEQEQVRETLESVNILKEQFAMEPSVFSFPFTDYKVRPSFFDMIAPYVDLSFGTAALKLDPVATHLQRIPMEKAGFASAAEILKMEYLLFAAKKLLNKHRILR